MLQREHFAILLAFIKLPVVIKTFILFIFILFMFEWLFYTGFTVVLIFLNILVLQEYSVMTENRILLFLLQQISFLMSFAMLVNYITVKN